MHEQCINSAWIVFFISYIVKSHDFTVHAKKKRTENVNAEFSAIQTGTSRYISAFGVCPSKKMFVFSNK